MLKRTLILEQAGKRVNATNSSEVMVQAGLNWDVVQEPIFRKNNNKIEGLLANIRQDNDYLLGIVSTQYQVVQNSRVFSFMDSLSLSGYIDYFSAGYIKGGRKVWVSAKLPNEIELIQGDPNEKAETYIVCVHGFDGKNSIRILITPVRVICNNVLNLAISNARRSFSITHNGDLEGKINRTREIITFTNKYNNKLTETVNKLTDIKVDVEEFAENLYPMKETQSKRIQNNVLEKRELFLQVLETTPDIKQHKDNGWGVINAVSDIVSHAEPQRKTSNYLETTFNKVVNGHSLLDKAYQLLKVA